MSLDSLVGWLAATKGSVALHESEYVYIIVESVHVLTLSLFVGFSALLDFRLLGWTLGRVPVSKVASRLLPWMIAGFAIMMATGALLFYAVPVRSYHSIFFRGKMVLLGLAGVNALAFHWGVWQQRTAWDLDVTPPKAARVAGATSLILWVCIILAGRLIAYDWFDCGRTQQPVVQMLSGCAAAAER